MEKALSIEHIIIVAYHCNNMDVEYIQAYLKAQISEHLSK